MSSPMRTPAMGLSPRVRGNLDSSAVGIERGGSIPARAGEPASTQKEDSLSQVYPRACGGTPKRWANWTQSRGLSPRVRGNRRQLGAEQGLDRSIPARAGEPRAIPLPDGSVQVYPRACGGTGMIASPVKMA